jgi:hypothetical protein
MPAICCAQDMMTYEDGLVAVLNIEALLTRAVYVHAFSRIRELSVALKANRRLFSDPENQIRVVEGTCEKDFFLFFCFFFLLSSSYTEARS